MARDATAQLQADAMTDAMSENRYHRQTLLPQVGREGQAKLRAARVLVVGCGALGTVIAEQLVRAGVGFIRIVDRDLVEWTNLQRQVLFDEADARDATPKAVAGARRLGQINAQVTIEPVVMDVDASNVEQLIEIEPSADQPGGRKVDLILDGTDNAAIRYLVNDVSIKHGVPWVYGACIGVEGRVMPVLPGQSACLRCVFPEAPGPGELPTCDTAGVLGAAVNIVASLQVVEALRLLMGHEVRPRMLVLDAWQGRLRDVSLAEARRPDCVCCGRRDFGFLNAPGTAGTTSLCGRDAVQVRPDRMGRVDLEQLARRLEAAMPVERNRYFLRIRPDGQMLTVFGDGRVIVSGTRDPGRARSLVSRYVG